MVSQTDLLPHLAAASARFADACAAADPAAVVPACPGWTVDDLRWHLTEVQDFWGSAVLGRPANPDDAERVSPPELGRADTLLRDRTARLVTALESADPAEACWSWDEVGGGRVAWVVRRQAHEALVHRVDAEQAVGWAKDPIPPEVAADGVDECLTVSLSGIPPWATFRGGGGTIALRTTDTGRAWDLELGRMTGTSLASGREYDLSALEVLDTLATPSVVVAASSVDLYLWLWGRGSDSGFEVDGDRALVGALRALAADATG